MRLLVYICLNVVSLGVLASPQFQAVNMNSASREQLMILPGIGEKLAGRILAHRQEKGPFASLDDLLLVKGMHPKLLEKISGRAEFSRTRSMQPKKPDSNIVSAVSKSESDEKIREQLARLKKEPNAKEIQEHALKYALAEPARIEEWLKRARIAPALPSLSFSAGRGTDKDATFREKQGEAAVLSKKDSSDLNLNVKVEWKFADLIFNQNELRVARESFRMSVIRERIISDVTKAYVERKKAKLKELSLDSGSLIQREELQLRVEELESILDGLTGGWFSEKIANS